MDDGYQWLHNDRCMGISIARSILMIEDTGTVYKVQIIGHLIDKDGIGDPEDWDWGPLADRYGFVTEPIVKSWELEEMVYANGKFFKDGY